LINRALIRAEIPSSKEPLGLSRYDGKRTDGLTLVPWYSGHSATWDATVVHTLTASYVAQSAVQAGKAAEIAADRKSAKYSGLSSSHIFIPVAVIYNKCRGYSAGSRLAIPGDRRPQRGGRSADRRKPADSVKWGQQ